MLFSECTMLFRLMAVCFNAGVQVPNPVGRVCFLAYHGCVASGVYLACVPIIHTPMIGQTNFLRAKNDIALIHGDKLTFFVQRTTSPSRVVVHPGTGAKIVASTLRVFTKLRKTKAIP